MSQAQKIPFPSSLSQFLQQRIEANQQAAGQIYPCHVTEVNGAIVTVNFDVDAGRNTTLPAVTCPVIGSIYIRVPIQVGDFGICISASTRLGGVTGLGSGLAPLLNPSNLGGLVFVPIGNSGWITANIGWGDNNSDAVVLQSNGFGTIVTIAPSGVTISGSLTTTGNVVTGTGVTGSFTTYTGQIVTVQDGIVTNIY